MSIQESLRWIEKLFPICRSITGEGLRETLRAIQERIPIELREVPSGHQVLDWTVPPEWNIKDAYIAVDGERLVDFRQHNLHVVNYSQPIEATMRWQELRPKLCTLPDQPKQIPYRTSYYQEDWGFCLSHEQLLELESRSDIEQLDFEVKIDSSLNDQGSLTYGELFIPGKSSDECLFTCHVCHPSLANDNLSAVSVAVALAESLLNSPTEHRLSYRFLFAPGTIGTIAWLARNPFGLARIRYGLVLSLLGRGERLIYKKTKQGNHNIDAIVQQVLAEQPFDVLASDPFGYDERQHASVGIDLPVGRLSRAREGSFPEYHTSGDNLAFLSAADLADSFAALQKIVAGVEAERYFQRVGRGEVQLGKRDLYPIATELLTTDEQKSPEAIAELQRAVGWLQGYADGVTGLTAIAHRSEIPLTRLLRAAELLVSKGVLTELPLRALSSMHGTPSLAAKERQARAHELIPGGAHTYAKGDDQFPESAPCFFERGEGCFAYDSDGNRFIEYGIGLRSVGLGHAHPVVNQAVAEQLSKGANFTRPTTIELEVAEKFLELLPAADMVKFTKNGSDATTAAIRLARAQTGRKGVLLCRDQPFFSVDDWFIGTTAMDAGIPAEQTEDIRHFPYNDIEALEQLFQQAPESFACLIMEAANYSEPASGYFARVQELCAAHGTLFVLDEMITGFRWNLGGAQTEYKLTPDLSTFGKALGNGFSVAALAGKREHMELGGILHDRPRVFLLSYTHGAESHCLAAARATIETYQQEPVIATLYRQGERLKQELTALAQQLGIDQHFYLLGRGCNLIYVTEDAKGQRSQAFRTLLLEQLIARGIFSPSLVVSYAHDDSVIDRTIEAFAEALPVYRHALEMGTEKFLKSRPSKPVFRKYN